MFVQLDLRARSTSSLRDSKKEVLIMNPLGICGWSGAGAGMGDTRDRQEEGGNFEVHKTQSEDGGKILGLGLH